MEAHIGCCRLSVHFRKEMVLARECLSDQVCVVTWTRAEGSWAALKALGEKPEVPLPSSFTSSLSARKQQRSAEEYQPPANKYLWRSFTKRCLIKCYTAAATFSV